MATVDDNLNRKFVAVARSLPSEAADLFLYSFLPQKAWEYDDRLPGSTVDLPNYGHRLVLNRYFADDFVFRAKQSDQKFGYYKQSTKNLVGRNLYIESDGAAGGFFVVYDSHFVDQDHVNDNMGI